MEKLKKFLGWILENPEVGDEEVGKKIINTVQLTIILALVATIAIRFLPRLMGTLT